MRNTDSEISAKKERIALAAMLVPAVLLLWVWPLPSSLWLDETGTFWVVKDGLSNAIARPLYWSGQSLYYLAAWAAFTLGGTGEAALRAPSFLAMCVAAWLLYRLAARVIDAAAAPLVVLVFICSEQAAFAAADARPYALALACLIGSALALTAWLDTGRTRFAAAYAGLTALTLHVHYLFALALAALGIYAFLRVFHERRVGFGALAACWASVLALSLPLVPQLLQFYRARSSHSFADAPAFSEFLASVAPPVLVGSAGLGFLVAWLAAPRASNDGAKRNPLALAAAWAVLPPLTLYLVSVFTETRIFVPRYFVSSAPAIALIAGWLIRVSIAGPARRIVAAAIVAGSIFAFASPFHGGDDWAGAMRAVRSAAAPGTPVLIASGFVEATDPEALDDPRLKEVLFAPLVVYPAAGRVIRLPFRLNEQSIPYLERLLPDLLENHSQFIFVGRWQSLSFHPWLRGRAAARGFAAKSLGNFGNVGVFLFSRTGPA